VEKNTIAEKAEVNFTRVVIEFFLKYMQFIAAFDSNTLKYILYAETDALYSSNDIY